MLTDFDLLKQDSMKSKSGLESKIQLLENSLEHQSSETTCILKNIENDRAELKLFRDKLLIENKQIHIQKFHIL